MSPEDNLIAKYRYTKPKGVTKGKQNQEASNVSKQHAKAPKEIEEEKCSQSFPNAEL